MKKAIVSLLVLSVLFALTACGRIAPALHTPDQGTADIEAGQTGNGDNVGNVDDGGASDFESTGDYWEDLRAKWRSEPEEGFVWTVSIDAVTVLDALGLTETTYDLDLSCSHVGTDMNGIYCGSLAMDFKADLSGLNALMGAMGGTASTSVADGWFRNDEFVMELLPYSAEKEQAFIGSLDIKTDENGEVIEEPSDPYTDAIAASLLEGMGSGSEQFEKDNVPVSYWFDWDYHMTEGDMSQSYSVSGVMGIADASGGQDASGSHISGGAVAHSPLGGTITERYDETFDAPFPYIIRVYDTGDVVFELHSPMGGPVVIKFYGSIDAVPVSETTVVKD